MRRMRSLTFPKISTSIPPGEDENSMAWLNQFAQGHSRESSGASSASSPVPSTFSSAGHGRWPGSTSSLETTPESPVNVAKALLHDLVEDPEERDDLMLQGTSSNADEPFCICDTLNCDHRKTIVASPGATASPEWTHGDDHVVDFSGLADGPSFKRRKSGDASVTGAPKRRSRRWPSITKRWSDRKATTSLSSPAVRSAPPSRSTSLQSPSLRRSLASHLGQEDPITPPATPARSRTTSITRPKPPPEPLNIQAAETADDPVDREAQSSTPLLPPVMTSLRRREEEEEVHSPLQSPSVAPVSSRPTDATPLSSPVSPITTPSLSTKPSIASITIGHHRSGPSSDISALPSFSSDADPWADKLRHANFTVYPEPYIPDVCDHKSCNVLLENWELARSRYMRHAARIAENYGPTSQTYRYTEQKWAVIDARWRANLEEANEEAEACGEAPASQSLAETQPVSRMPSLNDPQQPNKFPVINEDDIVGPMVQYARASAKPAKKSTFLKLLTSPTALFSGRRRPSV